MGRAPRILEDLALQIDAGVAERSHDDVRADALVVGHVAAGVGEPRRRLDAGRGEERRLACPEHHVHGICHAVAVAIGKGRRLGEGQRPFRRVVVVALSAPRRRSELDARIELALPAVQVGQPRRNQALGLGEEEDGDEQHVARTPSRHLIGVASLLCAKYSRVNRSISLGRLS